MSEAPNPVTYDHYAAFGMIVRVVAEVDGLFDQIIIAMVNGDPTVLPILTLLGTKDKMDYVQAIAKESTFSVKTQNDFEKLISRARKIHGLRNQIAHSGWMAGRRKGTVKPITMYARATLRMLGIDHNEKEWTADELKAEAKRFAEVGHDLAAFMKNHGLIPRMWQKSSGKNSRKSQSRGG